MTPVTILGAGPAGSSAAISARLEGAPVTLVEKSKFPRHKVCGEFFSPEIVPALEKIGAWNAFRSVRPAPVRRMILNFGRREKIASLPETAWGLSRYAFDKLLADRALELGAGAERETAATPNVIATGRTVPPTRRGQRLFGFKAHFEGSQNDAVELYFFSNFYIGVSPVENGRTNVCGLGPEHLLRAKGFDFDAVIRETDPLAARLNPLRRSMEWLSIGPLEFRQTFANNCRSYLAGDALSFVDPFTGSGLVAAVRIGTLAGVAATRAMPSNDYVRQCRASLARPFEVASLLRGAALSGWIQHFVGVAPVRLLFRWTRPR